LDDNACVLPWTFSTKSKSYIDLKSGKTFLELTTAETQNLLDGILLERKIYYGLNATIIPSEPYDDRYEIFERVEEVKMLFDNVNEPLLNLDKCSLSELINILQDFANDPSFNVHQTGFGSYIANHVIKEKIQRYNNEAMIPPKLDDVWIPKILISVEK
jgi:hypothetical protein